MCFNSKSYVIHSPFGENIGKPKLVKLTISDLPGSRPANPTFMGRKFYSIITKNQILEIDAEALYQNSVGNALEVRLDNLPDGLKCIASNLKLSSDYISWALSSNMQNLFLVDSGGSKEASAWQTAEAAQCVENKYFGLTCCGASISRSLEYSACGDFAGNIVLFRNEESAKPILKIQNEASVRYLHFHDGVENLLFIGGLAGGLDVLKFDDSENLVHEKHRIFTTD